MKVRAERLDLDDLCPTLNVKDLEKKIPNNRIPKAAKSQVNSPENRVAKFIDKSGLVGVTESEIKVT